MNGDAVWHRRPRWVHRVVTGGVVLFAPGRAQGTSIEGAAVPVWLVLDEPGTTAEIVGRARALSPVELSAEDVAEALDVLRSEGLVEAVT